MKVSSCLLSVASLTVVAFQPDRAAAELMFEIKELIQITSEDCTPTLNTTDVQIVTSDSIVFDIYSNSVPTVPTEEADTTSEEADTTSEAADITSTTSEEAENAEKRARALAGTLESDVVVSCSKTIDGVVVESVNATYTEVATSAKDNVVLDLGSQGIKIAECEQISLSSAAVERNATVTYEKVENDMRYDAVIGEWSPIEGDGCKSTDETDEPDAPTDAANVVSVMMGLVCVAAIWVV